MIRVHIWKTKLRLNWTDTVATSSSAGNGTWLSGWGHVAVEAVDRRQPLYMSYWCPELKPDSCSAMVQEDEADCGAPADEVIEINHLNLEAIAAQWEVELDQPYHWRNHNCCTVTANLLDAGCRLRDWNELSRGLYRQFRALLNPWKSADAFLTRGVHNVVGLWTPAAVRDYASYLKTIVE